MNDQLAILTPEILRQLISYEPESGKLFWLPRDTSWFSETVRRNRQHTCNQWNAKNAGSEALSYITARGYLVGHVLRMQVKAHRAAWAIHKGLWPIKEIDHINGIKSDNRISNLRDIDGAANSKNLPIARKNTSGRTGVAWSKAMGKWHAYIRENHIRHHLGFFDDLDGAVLALEAAEKVYGFHPNHGRSA